MAEEQAEPQPQWVGEPAAQVYANVMLLAAGPFDATLIFGRQDHSQVAQGGSVTQQEVVRVSMSWGHLKSMIPLMARLVAEYETRIGEIPAPGFDQTWKD